MKKRLFAAIVAAATAASPAMAETLNVGLILPGPVTDGTFNQAAYEGVQEAEERYDLNVSIRENTDFAEMEEVLLSYARDGYDVIIAHGFQFGEPVMEIHGRYPDSWFVVNTAQVAAEPNVASFDNRWGEAGYVAGAIAAMASETGVIGHVGGIEVPVIVDYNAGFEMGAKSINPDVEVLSAYVGSFSDVSTGYEITTSMIERGADVVTSTGNENVMGTIRAAQDEGVWAIGSAFDSYELAPGTVITSALIRMDVNIDEALGRITRGELTPDAYVLGFAEGGVDLASFREHEDRLSADQHERIEEIIADIKAGRIADIP